MKWRPRFSLRSLFVAVTLCAVLASAFATITEKYRREIRAIRIIQSHGGACYGDPAPIWLQWLYGPGLCVNVDSVYFDFAPESSELLATLKEFPNLRQVWMSAYPRGSRRVEIGPQELAIVAQFPGIEELLIDNTTVDDEGVRTLLSLRKLRKLSLANTEVTDEGFAELLTLPNLSELCLDRTAITDAGLERLSMHPPCVNTLIVLHLQHTAITDAGILHLQNCHHLGWLDISATRISASTLPILGELRELDWLTLDGTAIGEADLSPLLRLPKLTALNVRNCDLSEELVCAFMELRPDVDVCWADDYNCWQSSGRTHPFVSPILQAKEEEDGSIVWFPLFLWDE